MVSSDDVGGESESELLKEAESDHFGFGGEIDFGVKNITGDDDDSVFVTRTFVLIENVVDFFKDFLVFDVTDGFSNVDIGKVVDTDFWFGFKIPILHRFFCFGRYFKKLYFFLNIFSFLENFGRIKNQTITKRIMALFIFKKIKKNYTEFVFDVFSITSTNVSNLI